MLLFLGMTISSTSVASPLEDDLDVKISASILGTDIGFRIRVEIRNNRNENITVYYNKTVDTLFLNKPDFNHSQKINLNGTIVIKTLLGFKLSRFIISVEGGNTKVMREGLKLFRLYIFFK